MNIQNSSRLFQQAQTLFPGGVNSPVRAFRAVGGQPLFIARGEGAYLFDVDGNRYIDHVLSWGPLITGHAHPEVVKAIPEAALMGTSYGAPSPLEIELAKRIMEFMPNIEMIRFVNSGTEATMSALRLARFAWRANGSCVQYARGAVQRFGIGGSPLQKIPRPDRRRHRRACGGKYGRRPAAAWILGRTALAHYPIRRGLDLRRSDDRLPRPQGRRADALQHPARFDDIGQSYRRWTPRRRVWREARDHATGRAARTDVSGGDALG